MPRRRSESELEVLRAQAIALDQKIKEVAARDRAKREADERRRRQIAGAAALDYIAKEPQSAVARTLVGLIDQYTRSSTDRALFDLPPIPKSEMSAKPRRLNGDGSEEISDG